MEGITRSRQVDGVSVRGVAAFHDESGGAKRGTNTIYVVDLDGVEFCHLGDLGHELSAQQSDEIGSPHVLFIPVGGFYTIGPDQARAVMQSLKPLITVPMHYRITGMSKTFDALSTVEDFLQPSDNVRRLDGASFTVNQDELPDKPLIVVPKLV
jgi:L-ascorbate metabolism protein UlaG (beta-lactamase superfamily)